MKNNHLDKVFGNLDTPEDDNMFLYTLENNWDSEYVQINLLGLLQAACINSQLKSIDYILESEEGSKLDINALNHSILYNSCIYTSEDHLQSVARKIVMHPLFRWEFDEELNGEEYEKKMALEEYESAEYVKRIIVGVLLEVDRELLHYISEEVPGGDECWWISKGML